MNGSAIDLLEIPDVLDEAACEALRAELQQAESAPATVLDQDRGRVARPQARKATRIAAPVPLRERIVALLMRHAPALEQHFGLTLETCEEPQFLLYREGDYFVAHQDGNTPLVHDDSRFRRISVVIFLGRQSEDPRPGTYGGGSLVLYGPYSGPELRLETRPRPGLLVAFRAETTHEVKPITHGERFTIAAWFR